MSMTPPLRFLALVAGGWICMRAAMLAPDWAVPQAGEPKPTATPAPAAQATAATHSSPRSVALHPPAVQPHFNDRSLPADEAAALPERTAEAAAQGGFPVAIPPDPSPPDPPGTAALIGPIPPSFPPTAPRARHWSASAWLLLRDDPGGAALAPGGALGGSQAGARLLREVGGGVALSARLYLPLRRRTAAEAAAGLDWRPAAHLPLHLLAERRQALGRDGLSAFALTAYGGLSRALPRGFRIDAYAQAGLVGTRSRDPFADGSVRISAALGPVEVGGGGWAAAQPGVRRVDAGPSVSYRLPIRGAGLRLQVDWRFRLAGDTAPGSGPALTLAADF